jgi:large repetitive protein
MHSSFSNRTLNFLIMRFLAAFFFLIAVTLPAIAQPELLLQPSVRIAQIGTPVITSFSPLSGPVGTSITIVGINFGSVNAVKFNGTSATITSASATQLVVTVPNAATSGPISVTSSNGSSDVSALSFTVTSGPPFILGFSPISGPVGTQVTITGGNLNGATSVRFNNAASSFVVNNTTSIQAIVPSGATTGQITVTTPTGTITSIDSYTVTPTGSPVVSGFSPASGPVNTQVVITGANFNNVSLVTFDTLAASFTVNSSAQITATVPAGATSGLIAVTTSNGTATSASSFIVTSSTPTITGFSPTSGAVGTQVLISGNNFTGATAVKFNGLNATTFAVNSDIQISATVPSGAISGSISVTTPNGSTTSFSNFSVITIGAPVVSSFTPQFGSQGTVVTITGSSFSGLANVQFNGLGANFTVISETQITATVPVGATSGVIALTNANGVGISSSQFIVTTVGTTGYRFFAVSPCRIIDTRSTSTPFLAPSILAAFTVNSGGTTFNYSPQGGSATGCAIPTDAKAVFFNFVAVAPTGSGFFQAWPFGSPIPTASVLNYTSFPGLNIANSIALPTCDPSLATCTKDLNVQANQSTIQLVVDVVGYFK